MLKRIEDITLIFQSVWGRVLLFTQIEVKKNKRCKLDVYDSGQIHKIDLMDEDGFIEKIENTGVADINDRFYCGMREGGYEWCIRIFYNGKEIISGGTNAVPAELIRLMQLLGCDFKTYEQDISQGNIMDKTERIDAFCRIKERNHYLSGLWEEEKRDYKEYVYALDRPGFCKIERSEVDKNIKLRYSTLWAGDFRNKIEVWEQKGRLHYSWYRYHGDGTSDKVDSGISEYPVAKLDKMLEEMGPDQEIRPGKPELCPAFEYLDIYDCAGNEIRYSWISDNTLSTGLNKLKRTIREIIGEKAVLF